MPRNSSQQYNLPEPSFVGHTPIVADAMNRQLNDIAQTLTQSVATDGQTPITGVIFAASGSAGAPGYTFADDLDTGFYYSTSMYVVTGGLTVATISADSTITWAGDISFNEAVTFNGAVTYTNLVLDEMEVADADFNGEVIFEDFVDLSDGADFNGDIRTQENLNIGNLIELSDVTVTASAAASSIRVYKSPDNDKSIVWKDEDGVDRSNDWIFLRRTTLTNGDSTTISISQLSDYFDICDELYIRFSVVRYGNLSLGDDQLVLQAYSSSIVTAVTCTYSRFGFNTSDSIDDVGRGVNADFVWITSGLESNNDDFTLDIRLRPIDDVTYMTIRAYIGVSSTRSRNQLTVKCYTSDLDTIQLYFDNLVGQWTSYEHNIYGKLKS